MNFKIIAAAMTHVGLLRRNNEDNFFLNGTIRKDIKITQAKVETGGPAKEFLAAAADGMGGEALGEVASLIAVQSLAAAPWEKVEVTAQNQIQQANNKICEEMRINQGRRIGSTLVCLYIDKNKAKICNLGDSRAYLLRNDKLTCLTRDHTRAELMEEMGILTKEECKNHPSRNELMRHLGIFEEEIIVEPEFSNPIELEADDVFLLCTDGLTDLITDEEIRSVLQEKWTPARQTDILIQKALDAGGNDNVTVLIVKIIEDTESHQENSLQKLWQKLTGKS